MTRTVTRTCTKPDGLVTKEWYFHPCHADVYVTMVERHESGGAPRVTTSRQLRSDAYAEMADLVRQGWTHESRTTIVVGP